VKAVNPAGLFSTAPSATVFVDTVPPKVSFRITGTQRVGSTLHIRINATDAPPPIRRSDASGISSIALKWGDGTKVLNLRTATHTYLHRGTYVVTVIVKDRAGNRTVVTQRVTIKPMLKPTRKRPRRHTK
jgi:PKD repeat protein